jgi:hypothetical protein
MEGLAALAFKVITTGPRPLAVVQGLDVNGDEHLLAVRVARHGAHAAYLQLFEDVLRRGLQASPPLLVDAGGCRWLERRIERALGRFGTEVRFTPPYLRAAPCGRSR